MKNFCLYVILVFLFLIPFFVFAQECPSPETYVCNTEKQEVDQYKCTKGACGGTIEFMKRRAKRECRQTCTDYYTQQCDEYGNCTCVKETVPGPWTCDPWEFKDERVIKTYDTSQHPWLVCTYKYDQLEDLEKERAKVKYPYKKIICTENNCPEVDEIAFFPPVYDSDSYDFFHKWIKPREKRFFEIAQIACWGKCLDNIKGRAHYFGGAINPKRDVDDGEQDPSKVRLPVKFGWEYQKERWGISEWEEAFKFAKQKDKENLEKGLSIKYLKGVVEKRSTSTPIEIIYGSPPEEGDVKRILKDKWGEEKWKEEFVVEVEGHQFIRALGVGSFYFKLPIERLLRIAEGQEIPPWQTPASVGSNEAWKTFEKTGDITWTKIGMTKYFDYYFLNETAYPENQYQFGFSGKLENGELFVYSPSQDSKKDFLWFEYKDPKENGFFLPGVTKQIRIKKNEKTHGPCEIAPFATHELKIFPCCNSDGENCSPRKPEGEGWNFTTKGPEPKAFLGIKAEIIRKILPISLDTYTTYQDLLKALQGDQKIEGKIYRFIDIDWDRIWPSERFLKAKGGTCEQGAREQKFFLGSVRFDQERNETEKCKMDCWKACDSSCLPLCEKEYLEVCLKMCEKMEGATPEEIGKCKEDCEIKTKELFKRIRETKCPECKASERNWYCIVCRSCENEVKACQKTCIEECEQKIREKEKLEELECDEICREDPQLDLLAARGECDLLKNEKRKKLCEHCQKCKYKADYIDIEWCQAPADFFSVAIYYKEKEDAKNLPFKEALKEYSKRTVAKNCEPRNLPSPCQEDPCKCFLYDEKGNEIYYRAGCPEPCFKDIFVQNPFYRGIKDFSFECKPGPEAEEKDCYGIFQLNKYDHVEGGKLVSSVRRVIERWKIMRDFYKEYGDLEETKGKEEYWVPLEVYSGELKPKQNWFEWDKALLPFNSFSPNGIVIAACYGEPFPMGFPPGYQKPSCQGSSLRWDFVIETLSKNKLCDVTKNECIGEKDEDYPVCWKIRKERVVQDFPPEKDIDKENRLVVYRHPLLLISPLIDRIFSFRMKIKDWNDSFVKLLPKSATHSTHKEEEKIVTKAEEKSLFEFPFYDIWNALPPLGDALGRLKKKYTFLFTPCWDELGFNCSEPLVQKAKITGEPPQFPFEEESSGPPPPRKVKIPRFFNWDPAPGAASYWIEVDGRKEFILDLYSPDRSKLWVSWVGEGRKTWKVRTCADICSEEGMELCGEWGEYGPFEGYFLEPPKEMTSNVAFFPDESISLSWGPIANGTDCTHIRVVYKGSIEETRKDCIEKIKSSPEGYVVLDQIYPGQLGGIVIPNYLLPRSSEVYTDKVSGISTNVCLGDYYYTVRYCTGENCARKIEECGDLECKKSAQCQEAGAFSFGKRFLIVTRKGKGYGGGFGGFGTCKNLIPCTECHLSHIPKIISNIMSCILWTLSPIACIFLLIYTGIGLYFSFGAPEAVERAKKIWKMVGIGWLIMLFSWTIVNLIIKTLKLE